MLALVKVEEVRRLLDSGELSIRKISRLTGVSRTVISQIAAGKRPDYLAARRERELERGPSGPVARCGGCGGLVEMPCLACRVRQRIEERGDVARAGRLHARRNALARLIRALRRAYWRREASDRGSLPRLAANGPVRQFARPAAQAPIDPLPASLSSPGPESTG